MLNLVREGEEDYIEAIRYRRCLKIFENFLFFSKLLFGDHLVQKGHQIQNVRREK